MFSIFLYHVSNFWNIKIFSFILINLIVIIILFILWIPNNMQDSTIIILVFWETYI